MNASRGSSKRGGRSRGRPGPPSWPHGTAPEDRGKFAPSESAEVSELPDVDWDEMRRQVSDVVVHVH